VRESVSSSDIAPTPAQAVKALYQSLASQDVSAVEHFCTQWLDPDVTLDLPASLPYGGRICGAGRIGRLFRSMCQGPGDTGPRDLRVISVVGSPTHVCAELAFDYVRVDGVLVSTGAVELWKLDRGTFVAVEAYYRDTASLVIAE